MSLSARLKGLQAGIRSSVSVLAPVHRLRPWSHAFLLPLTLSQLLLHCFSFFFFLSLLFVYHSFFMVSQGLCEWHKRTEMELSCSPSLLSGYSHTLAHSVPLFPASPRLLSSFLQSPSSLSHPRPLFFLLFGFNWAFLSPLRPPTTVSWPLWRCWASWRLARWPEAW